MSPWSLVRRIVHAVRTTPSPRARARATSPAPDRPRASAPAGYPGDFTGRPRVTYSPAQGGTPDPGEVVWTWVPYEDDPGQGKDRPVLVLGHDGPLLAGVQLSSRDHDGRRDEHEWVPVGSGAWDRQGRPSYADASRLLRFEPSAVRREGAALARDRFEAVLERVEQLHDWRR